MKNAALRFLSVLGLCLAAVAALDLSQVIHIVPEPYAGKILAGGLVLAALRDFVLILGDVLDDGKRNNSFRPVVTALLVCSALLTLPSCVATKTTVTAPDGTVTVTEYRGVDAPVFHGAVEAATAIAAQK